MVYLRAEPLLPRSLSECKTRLAAIILCALSTSHRLTSELGSSTPVAQPLHKHDTRAAGEAAKIAPRRLSPNRFHKRRSGLRMLHSVCLSCQNFRVARPSRSQKRDGCRRLLPYRFASDQQTPARKIFHAGELIDRRAGGTASFQGLFFGFSFGVLLGRVPLALSARRRGNIAERRDARTSARAHIERSLPSPRRLPSALIETEILRARRSNHGGPLHRLSRRLAKRSVF